VNDWKVASFSYLLTFLNRVWLFIKWRRVQFVMQRYTPKERAEMLKLFYENQSSIVTMQRAFRAKFRRQTAPNGRTLRRLSVAFLETGVVTDVQHSGRQRNVWTTQVRTSNFFEDNDNKAVFINMIVTELCWAIFWHHKCTNLAWKACISNKMAFHVIHRLPQSLLCVKYFLVSKFGDITWPPRSPDLTPPDFFCETISKARFISIVHSLSLLWQSTYRKKLQHICRNTTPRYEKCPKSSLSLHQR